MRQNGYILHIMDVKLKQREHVLYPINDGIDLPSFGFMFEIMETPLKQGINTVANGFLIHHGLMDLARIIKSL